MQLIVIFFLLLTTAFSKTNWCEFNSDFAEEYLKARKNYANKLKNDKQVKWASPDEYDTGYMRAKKFRDKWKPISIKTQVQNLFGDREIIFKAKDNGKLMIYPKDFTDNSPIILVDPSGDYFRVVKAKLKNGEVIDQNTAYTSNGLPPMQPKGVSDSEWQDMKLELTHFIAKP